MDAQCVNVVRFNGTPHEPKPVVVALHCSGGSGRQWRPLGDTFGTDVTLITPDLFGAPTNPWHGERPFTLAEEAAPVIGIIDAQDKPVHLVGHSYGAAVALRAAVRRPSKIASLSLYEPAAFHILKSMGAEGRAALTEIEALGQAFVRCVLNGAYQSAAQEFADYWSGAGTWASLKPKARGDFARYVPKGCLEFRAAINDRSPQAAYGRLRIPTLLMQGEAANPSTLVVRRLQQLMRPSRCEVVVGAGHMGPSTHADEVARLISDHIVQAGADSARRRAPRGLTAAA